MSRAIERIKRGDELIDFSTGEIVVADSLKSGKNVILIHGFTAHGEYMNDPAETFRRYGLGVYVFDYDSYKGIDRAAASLHTLLESLNSLSDGAIVSNKVSLVCHSMGGLVARSFCQAYSGDDYVDKVVTLGTPHAGTLLDSRTLGYLVKVGESLAGSGVLRGYHRSCKSAMQLMGKDAESSEDCLVAKMGRVAGGLEKVQKLSISGGKRRLIVGKGKVANALMNNYLQKKLSPGENDGLVAEVSSDWSANFPVLTNSPRHYTKYPEYENINHSFLINNHSISLKVVEFLKAK